MLTLCGRAQSTCQGITRREFVRVGGLGLAGLTLSQLQRATASTPNTRPKSVIYVVLSGGPSHIDTWDMKPQAPTEFRGPFKPISTMMPGVQVCELFPKQAQILNRFALIRGIRSVENDHFLSEVYTGLPRTAGARPAFGSVVSKLLGNYRQLPAYVSLSRETTDRFEFEKPHYAGAGHAPFRPFGDALDNMTPAKSLDLLQDRKGLLKTFDTIRRDVDSSQTLDGLDRFQMQALEIMTSPKVRKAFDLSQEDPRTFDRYGRGAKYTHQTVKSLIYPWDTKPFILARRLVEAGVRVVTVSIGSWDHHSGPESDIFLSYRHCLPALDQSLYALMEDLEQRGLLDDVLVVVLGEFGRTPKITYPGPGREHWADAGCALIAGAGVKVGQVIGETDARAEQSKTGHLTFQSIMSSIYQVLGIDPKQTLPDFTGRPNYLLDEARPIDELF